MISDFTELATRLYFWAASRARRVLASTTSLFSSPRAIRITGRKCRRVKISVRSNSISFVPSVRHSKDNSLRRKRSVAQMNIIITQLFAAATNASSGVRTPACPCASGGSGELHLGAVSHLDVSPVVAGPSDRGVIRCSAAHRIPPRQYATYSRRIAVR